MKKLLLLLTLVLLFVNCGGDNTQSDYYQGETHKINGKVMGLTPSELNNSKVTLYLDDQSEPIATAKVDENGEYTLAFTPEVHANIEANQYALLDAKGGGKSFKSIVTYYSSTPEKAYDHKDTKISAYTDAIYKIKKSLKFDRNATTMLVQKFINLYKDGTYDSAHGDAYAFAYNGAMDELAENNEYSYWHNFISYYLATPELYTRYKLYTYHYPSYKHITYNARKLKELLNHLKNSNTLIGRNLWKNNGLTIIGHSMGGLVARSMIEEHEGLGGNADVLAKLITLDTPHHGSQGANLYHASAWVSDSWFSKKDMRTAGAVDLIWDNYDNYYKGDAFDWTVNQGNRANDDWNHREHNSRVAILNDGGNFDRVYMQKLNAISYEDTTKSRTNPFLAYLNTNFRQRWKAIAQSTGGNKYTFYIAHSSSSQLLGGQVSNPIATAASYMASTATINSFGYGSGGATPVCSAFFSWDTSVYGDKITKFDGSFTTPEKFIKIENGGDPQNDNIAYRYFWDYDHQSMLAGRAPDNQSWDIFISGNTTLTSDDCSYSTYYNYDGGDFNPEDDESLDCYTQHQTYYNYANNYFKYRINKVLSHDYLSQELSNPLKTEPLFMILHKDLLDIYEGR